MKIKLSKANKGYTLTEVVVVVVVLGAAATVVAGGYVAVHFLMKAW